MMSNSVNVFSSFSTEFTVWLEVPAVHSTDLVHAMLSLILRRPDEPSILALSYLNEIHCFHPIPQQVLHVLKLLTAFEVVRQYYIARQQLLKGLVYSHHAARPLCVVSQLPAKLFIHWAELIW